jgi:Pectinacetylesterase
MKFTRSIMAAVPALLLIVPMQGNAQASPNLNDIKHNTEEWYMHDLGELTSCLRSKDNTFTSAKVLYHEQVDSRKLVIYVSGGGSCNSIDSCKGQGAPKNIKGYGAEQFQSESKIVNNLYLRDRPPEDAPSLDNFANPFRYMNRAMIPYCTGDMHSGNSTQYWSDSNGNVVEHRFWGHRNFQAAISYLREVFPNVDKIYLIGASAGAGGAILQYPNVVAKWTTSADDKPEVNLIEDSAPVVVGPVTAEANRTAWNPSCDFGRPGGPNCIGAPEMRLENSNLPNNRPYKHAILRFSWDGVLFPISELDSLAKYNTKVSGKNDEFETTPGATATVRQLTIVNTKKTNGTAYCPRHVVTNFNVVDFTFKVGTIEQVQQKSDIEEAHHQFITDMVNSPTWTSRSLDLFQPTSSEPEIGCPASQNDLLRTKTRVKNASR